jgi:capsular polysaccharide biosynthesis protein
MSFLEQIILFAHADIIVAAHGSGMANMMFCKPGALFVEIFQGRSDSTYCYLPQRMDMRYACLQTMEFEDTRGHQNSQVSVTIVQEFIDQNRDWFDEDLKLCHF